LGAKIIKNVLKPAVSIIFFEIPLIYAQFFGVLMLKHFESRGHPSAVMEA